MTITDDVSEQRICPIFEVQAVQEETFDLISYFDTNYFIPIMKHTIYILNQQCSPFVRGPYSFCFLATR
jgi:hypothetical protein